jgi:predicted CopG family antitoxin
MKKIEIDDEVYRALLRLAESFEDTPNSILRRLLRLNKISLVDEKEEETALEEMRKIVGIKDTSISKFKGVKGKITHVKDYYIPILESLMELGGCAKAYDVLERVREKMIDVLTEMDLELLPSGNDLRWRNKAQWARFLMIKEGLLKNNSPKGVWEITEYGKKYIEKACDKT